ncbi:MAG: GAF domain-containing protein [Gammaproteobacteria bacterium]|nr:GAF domain-containing protein [Gammaproteobacteria bacterium]
MLNVIQDPVLAVEKFVKTTISLSGERDLNRLLNRIVTTARELTGAEAGRVYILDRAKQHLYPEVSQNNAVRAPLNALPVIPLFLDRDERNMSNICAYCAFLGKPVNLADVYSYSGFNCADLYDYDQRGDYRTQSLLAVPLRGCKDITIGILLLLNYRDPKADAPAAFPETMEHLAKAFAAQAAVVLDNTWLIEENTRLIEQLAAVNRNLEQENRELKQEIACRHRFNDTLIGESVSMQQVFRLMEKVLDSGATVFLHGETGTGKELIAAAIHQKSRRGHKAFIAQNCAALPENLLESELFGYKRGAFSGADKDKKGLIEAAHGGTLFLDEIGDMPVGLQAKLLRFLQERQVRPVGSVETRKVDVRIIAATHRNLEELIRAGTFREDLYYRLYVFPITLPPLRERKEDLPALLQHFLKQYAERYDKKVHGYSPEALEILLRYDYPGNIRQLKNLIERAVLLSDDGDTILPTHLDRELVVQTDMSTPLNSVLAQGKLKDIMQHYEAAVIQQHLLANRWNQTRAAQSLGISRRALVDKIGRYQLGKER